MTDQCPHCELRTSCNDVLVRIPVEECEDYRPIKPKRPRVYRIFKQEMSFDQLKNTAEWEGWTFERIGPCECGSIDYILMPAWSSAVREGGKDYLICAHCGGNGGHL
jgi:hypothetical protein